MMKRLTRFVFALVVAVTMGCGPVSPQEDQGQAPDSTIGAAPVGASLEISELVGQLRTMAWAEEVDAAQTLIEAERPYHDQATPGWLLAASWLGRGASFAERWDVAEAYATEAVDGSVSLLADRELDAEGQLPLALGAGIEVLGHARDAKGDRAGAVEFLAEQRERYEGTSVETRIQKNVLLLSLEGQPFPVLDVDEYLGQPLPSADSLKGKVVVAFFWAHWCPDCKRQLPVLERIHDTFGDQVEIIGPTQLYGYVAGGQDAAPQEELAFLRGAYQERFPIPDWMSVPVSQQNFLAFGVSTTPTLVVIDREGTVRLYNPGDLPYEELAPTVERLLDT